MSTCLFINVVAVNVFGQGALTPSGAPAPTMKTLQQVEPRMDVLTLPADSAALHAIKQPGSYYLTTNILGVSNVYICAISIEADNVSLDLNGFTLLANGGYWSGIWIYGLRTNVTIVNGTSSGWGDAGVFADGGAQLRLERLQCNGNKYSTHAGIYAPNTTQCIIKDCQAQGNAGHGFSVGAGAVLQDSCAVGNGNCGVYCTSDSVVRNCLAMGNRTNGITVGSYCFVEHNTCNGNSGYGIYFTGNNNRIDSNHCINNTRGVVAVSGAAYNVIVRNSAFNYNGQSAYSLGGLPFNGPVVQAVGTASSSTGWENWDYIYIGGP